MTNEQASKILKRGKRVLVHQVGFPQYASMGTVLRKASPSPVAGEDWFIVRCDDDRPNGGGCYHPSWLHAN
jgi:hypothetical protein